MRRFLGTLSGEDLGRYRQLFTRRMGMELNPTAYSKEETESTIMSYWKFFEEIHAQFQVPRDDLDNMVIEPVTGQVKMDDNV